MPRSFQYLFAYIIIAVVLVGVIAYAVYESHTRTLPENTNQQTLEYKGNLTVALGYWGPPSPFLFYPRGPGYVVTSFIFDTLVWKNGNGVIPWLATGWEHPDPQTWIFHIRSSAKWQDGTNLTAEDVVFTFNYLEKHGWTWKNVNPSLIKTIVAINDKTVEIKLSKPYAFFLEDYASTIFIIPKHIWENVSNPYVFHDKKSFIGSGPYELVSYNPQQGYLLKANPHFWGGKPLYSYIKILAVDFTDPQEEASAIINSNVDTATFMGKAYPLVKMIEQKVPNAKISSGPMYWVLFLGFNLNKWPYNQTTFRKAIAYSLNLTELVEKTGGGLNASIPGSPGYIPPYSLYYNPNIPKYPYDPVKAEAILNSLNLKDVNGDGCRELPGGSQWQPLLVTTKQYTQEALLIKIMLQRVGMCVSVKTVESYNQLDTLVKKGLYDMEINGHGATGNTPSAFSWYFTSRFGTAWNNSEYINTVAKIMSADNKSSAYKYSMQAQILIASQLPRIALYYPQIFVVTRPNIGINWFFTSNGIDGGIPMPYNKLVLVPSAYNKTQS
ncbi:MAG: ABC transporter substrate-binding protein [Desulfurococcales archaeon]|nr:ABC transporter substrate-binding protein [Desulfurococcales archaeon]